MLIGIDLDNTIINYKKSFLEILKSKNINSKNLNKKEVKKIIEKKSKREWTIIQGEIYGKKIFKAEIFKNFNKFLDFAISKNFEIVIISHKTKYPYHGKKIDLHKISLNWLKKNFFNKKNNIKACDCYFEGTQRKKISRIKKLKISHFVDDLKKVLDLVPNDVVKILYKQDNFKINKITKLIK